MIKRLFHFSMITIGLIAVLISFSGLYAKPTEESDISESNDLSLEEMDEIVTAAQHEYQLEEPTYTVPTPPDFSTYKGVTFDSDDSGHIFWEDPDGIDHETAFSMKDGIVTFADEDLIRDVDRSRFVSFAINAVMEVEVE